MATAFNFFIFFERFSQRNNVATQNFEVSLNELDELNESCPKKNGCDVINLETNVSIRKQSKLRHIYFSHCVNPFNSVTHVKSPLTFFFFFENV